MGGALVRGWLAAGCLRAEQLHVVEPDPARRAAAPAGAEVLAEPGDLAGRCDMLWIAVKPKDVAAAVTAALGQSPARPLLVSIAAGITIAKLQSVAPACPVIRVMPNTPALVGAGASVFARGDAVTADQAETVRRMLAAVGTVAEVPESLLAAVTGLSGSGPAYGFVMIEALADGGVRCGLPRTVAVQLAAQTLAGAARMVLETGDHPAALKDQVASPAGTTIAGLAALEAGGLRSALIEAVTAATRRAEELG